MCPGGLTIKVVALGHCKEMSRKEQRDTIFVGDGAELVAMYDRLKRPEKVLGVFCALDAPVSSMAPYMGGVDDVPGYLEGNLQVKRVYCCTSQIGVDQLKAVQQACKMRAVKFCAVLPAVNELDAKFITMNVGGHLLLTPEPEPLSKIYNLLFKRLFDILVSLLLLLTVFPVVYLVRYVMAKKRKVGAVLRVQYCTGPDGKEFPRLTFRPTIQGEGDGGCMAMPQLLNVLVGHLSLVGPKPLPVPRDGDDTLLPCRLERRFLKGGMTGWAQVRGREEASEALRDDIWYAEHWSWWLDIRILLKSALGTK